jgi:hypothetical protein
MEEKEKGKREKAANPVKETLASLKNMVPKPKKKLSLEEIDRAIGRGDRE